MLIPINSLTPKPAQPTKARAACNGRRSAQTSRTSRTFGRVSTSTNPSSAQLKYGSEVGITPPDPIPAGISYRQRPHVRRLERHHARFLETDDAPTTKCRSSEPRDRAIRTQWNQSPEGDSWAGQWWPPYHSCPGDIAQLVGILLLVLRSSTLSFSSRPRSAGRTSCGRKLGHCLFDGRRWERSHNSAWRGRPAALDGAFKRSAEGAKTLFFDPHSSPALLSEVCERALLSARAGTSPPIDNGGAERRLQPAGACAMPRTDRSLLGLQPRPAANGRRSRRAACKRTHLHLGRARPSTAGAPRGGLGPPARVQRRGQDVPSPVSSAATCRGPATLTPASSASS
mmetsp:Transcript_20784/g.48790  ORF Transcript_20784/g.48790 Transcript_20784/m.48790 type:complete len:342 (+) Transcript_20784:1667-2692(+)